MSLDTGSVYELSLSPSIVCMYMCVSMCVCLCVCV